MKLRKGDKVMVRSGRDKTKTGEILVVMSRTDQVVVQGVNIAKRHVKPSAKNPKGGIIASERPISVAKLMAVDPATGKPARIGYKKTESGEKTRVYKVSKFTNSKVAKSAAKAETKEKKTDKTKAGAKS